MFLDRLNVISTVTIASGLGAKIDPATIFLFEENKKLYQRFKTGQGGGPPSPERSREIWAGLKKIAIAHNAAEKERARIREERKQAREERRRQKAG